MITAKLAHKNRGAIEALSKKLDGVYEILVGLPNSGQRYPYRSYEYGAQKNRGGKKQSPTAPTSISTSSKPLPLVAQVAFWLEYGTETIPERPFLRSTIAINRKKYFSLNRKIIAKVLRKEVALEIGLKKFALIAQEDVKDAVHNWQAPPNADSTIKQKGVNSPLQYKGTLLRAIVGLMRKKR